MASSSPAVLALPVAWPAPVVPAVACAARLYNVLLSACAACSSSRTADLIRSVLSGFGGSRVRSIARCTAFLWALLGFSVC